VTFAAKLNLEQLAYVANLWRVAGKVPPRTYQRQLKPWLRQLLWTAEHGVYARELLDEIRAGRERERAASTSPSPTTATRP
jgi:hypothetical protein